jgi:hypothetical protein
MTHVQIQINKAYWDMDIIVGVYLIFYLFSIIILLFAFFLISNL